MLEQEVEGDLFLKDIGQGFGFQPGSIAEVRGSQALWKKWEQAKDGGMTPERAYSTLEVPSEIDDGMLITIFSMRVSSPFFLL